MKKMTNWKNRIKYTDCGFSYVKVTPYENISWGGFCVCNGCNGQFENEDMNLIFVLDDTYCDDCFKKWLERQKTYNKEDIEYDLKLQDEMSMKWYRYHLDKEYRDKLYEKYIGEND